MSTIVIGLDPSSKKIAVAISVNGRKPTVKTKVLSKDNPTACHEAEVWVKELVRSLRKPGVKVYLFVEDPVVGRGGARSTIMQALVQGGMLAGGIAGGAEVHKVNNSSWKKRVVGNGNMGKPGIKDWVRQNWPAYYLLSGGDQDLIDAGCILKYGQGVVEMKTRIEAARLDELEIAPRRIKRTR